MNILILFSHGWGFGGAETYTVSLIKQLKRKGYRVIFVSDFKKHRDVASPCKYHYQLDFKNVAKWVGTYQQLKTIINKHEIEIVHAQQRTAGYFAAILHKKMGTPFVVTLHDKWHRTPFKGFHGQIFSHVICVSNYIRDYYLNNFKGDPQHTYTVYNGVDIENFHGQKGSQRDNIRKEYGIRDNDIVLAIIGRISHKKGHIDVIMAVNEVRAQGHDARLLIIGDGDEKDRTRIEQVVRELDLKRHVIFTGYQKNVAPFLDAADVGLLPSYREAFGLVLVEAMLAKKPVIASNVGGIPEIVQDGKTGFIVEPGRVQQIAHSIVRLITDKELAMSFGQEGYRVAMEKFTLDKMVENTMKIYKKIIKENQKI